MKHVAAASGASERLDVWPGNCKQEEVEVGRGLLYISGSIGGEIEWVNNDKGSTAPLKLLHYNTSNLEFSNQLLISTIFE